MFYLILFLFILLLLGFLYLAAIMPQLKKPASLKILSGFRYYAHRGLHDNKSDAPENSLLAIRRAVEAGYGIELDVQLSKDGIPIVFHDFTLKRICKTNLKVSELSLCELKSLHLFSSEETIPTLEEVLAVVDGRVPLIIEYKLEGLRCDVCRISDELLSHYHGAYCIESFHPLAVYWYRKNRPQVVRGQLSSNFLREGEFSPALFLVRHLLFNFLTRPTFVAYNCIDKRSLSRTICRSLYKNLSVAWTIHSEKELADNSSNFDWFIFEGFCP